MQSRKSHRQQRLNLRGGKMRRSVEFMTDDGIVLRGHIHAGGTAPAPGIVMSHGFGGVQAQIDHYAAFFAEANFSVLVYDHRGFGISDGMPRQEVNPYRQLADWRDAISFAQTQSEFDSEVGFGVWGSSFAGGLAMVTAANDPRVSCVVAQIPNVSGHRNGARIFTPEQLIEMRRRAAADRVTRLSRGRPATVPMFPTFPGEFSAFMLDVPDGIIERASEAPSWKNEVTLRSLEHLVEFEPAGWMPYVSPKPLLMIIAENDVCTFTEIQRDVFADLPEPKKLISFPGGHFDAYVRFFRETAGPARDWFAEHLNGSVQMVSAPADVA
jgi:pimeloyl-ACP methyl ester carboxylesterase